MQDFTHISRVWQLTWQSVNRLPWKMSAHSSCEQTQRSQCQPNPYFGIFMCNYLLFTLTAASMERGQCINGDKPLQSSSQWGENEASNISPVHAAHSCYHVVIQQSHMPLQSFQACYVTNTPAETLKCEWCGHLPSRQTCEVALGGLVQGQDI